MQQGQKHMKNKKVAVIDVGTLKSKFEIREYTENREYTRLYADKKLTVLGRALSTGNSIDDESIRITCEALIEFNQKMEEFEVEKYRAVTTEAIRKASNGLEVIETIFEKTGIRLEILSQEEEAHLFFENISCDFAGERIAIMDIGGGSVQVMIGKDNILEKKYLLKTGTYLLQEMFSKGSLEHIVLGEELEKTKSYIQSHADEAAVLLDNIDTLVFGSTNMIEFLNKFDIIKDPLSHKRKHPYSVSKEALELVLEKILLLSYKERMELYPEEPYFMWASDRLILNVLEIAKRLGIKNIVPSNENISGAIMNKLIL